MRTKNFWHNCIETYNGKNAKRKMTFNSFDFQKRKTSNSVEKNNYTNLKEGIFKEYFSRNK